MGIIRWEINAVDAGIIMQLIKWLTIRKERNVGHNGRASVSETEKNYFWSGGGIVLFFC